MSKKHDSKADHDNKVMVRLLSKRPGDIILRSGKRFEFDKSALVTEDEAVELESMCGDFIKRID
jgi:hypothetical protein